MKKFISGLTIITALLVLASCGGASEEDMIGKWKVDGSSLELNLGDGVPAPIKSEIEEGKKEMKSNSKELEGLTIDFQKGGKLVLSMEGSTKTQEAKWKIEDDKLVISGEAEGMKGSLKLNCDVSGDVATLSLTGEEVLAQIKSQMPEMLKQAEGMDLEKMAAGSSVSISLKK